MAKLTSNSKFINSIFLYFFGPESHNAGIGVIFPKMVKCVLFGHRTHKMIDFESLGNIKIIMIMTKFGI